METTKILNFLEDLSKNNNRDWFQENKKSYENANLAMKEIVSKLISGISKFDLTVGSLDASDCLFRIYRDVRFSKNKDPYKTNMGGFIVDGGRNSGRAGYYFHLEPDNCFLGGGIYMPEAKHLKMIREEIIIAGEELITIENSMEFKKYFKKIEGDKLVRPPKAYDSESRYVEYLKMKSFTVLYPLDNEFLLKDNYIEQILLVFKAMHSLNQFINRALKP